MSSQRKNAKTPQKAGVPSQRSREGKKAVSAYFEPEVSLQLKQIGVQEGGRDLQNMLAEALNDFFVKKGKKPIAKG